MEEIVVKLGSVEAALAQDVLDSKERTEEEDGLKLFQREIGELKGLNQRFQDEVETLRKQVHAIEENISRQFEAAKSKKRPPVPPHLRLEDSIQKLEGRIVTLEEKSAIPARAEPMIVERPLTQDIKLVRAPRQVAEAISDNISVEKLGVVESRPPLAGTAQLSSKPLGFADIPRLSKIEILMGGANGAHQVRHGHSFGIRLIFDLAKAKLPEAESLGCKAVIYAKSLKGGRPEIIAEAQNLIVPKSGALDIEARAKSPGIYRLQAAVTFAPPEGGSTPNAASMESGIIYVY